MEVLHNPMVLMFVITAYDILSSNQTAMISVGRVEPVQLHVHVNNQFVLCLFNLATYFVKLHMWHTK